MRLTRRGQTVAALLLLALALAGLWALGPEHPCATATSVMTECHPSEWEQVEP